MERFYSVMWDIVLFLCGVSLFSNGYILGISIIYVISFVAMLNLICRGVENIKCKRKSCGYIQILISLVLTSAIIVRICINKQ